MLLHEELAAGGLRILAFPCNQFGKQEPGTEEEIQRFAVENFGAKFDLFGKVNVNGPKATPVFSFLKSRLPGMLGSSVKWNFTKFLVDKNGVPVQRYGPPTNPLAIRDDIVKLLAVAPHAEFVVAAQASAAVNER